METITIRTTADLIELIPMAMGYAPTERITVSCLTAGRVTVTAALPLDSLTGNEDKLLTSITSATPDQVVVIAYTAAPWYRTEPVAAFVRMVTAPVTTYMATATDWAMLDAYSTERGAELGDTVQRPTSPTAGMVAAVAAGLPMPTLTREDLAARIKPRAGLVMELGTTEPEAWNGEPVSDTVAQVSAQGLDPQTVRALAGSLLTEGAWNAWWEDMDAPRAKRECPLWCAVATYYADAPRAARIEAETDHVLLAAGFTAWLSGDGTLVVDVLHRLDARDRAGCIPTEARTIERAFLYIAHGLSINPARWLEAKGK